MILIAGENLKRGDKLTINKDGYAIKLKIGSIYIGDCKNDVKVYDTVEVVKEVKND
jgi:phage gp45-like